MFERFEVIPNAEMSQYTTLKLGGPADWLAFPRSREEIAAMFQEAGYEVEDHINLYYTGDKQIINVINKRQ